MIHMLHQTSLNSFLEKTLSKKESMMNFAWLMTNDTFNRGAGIGTHATMRAAVKKRISLGTVKGELL